ncbi:MAG: formylglycine-generating enzyme family protein [Cuspidothrix sp.]
MLSLASSYLVLLSDDNYIGAPIDGNAWFDDNKFLHDKTGCAVLRGGSWLTLPQYCRSASRIDDNRDYRLNLIGFRVVCVVGRILQ